MVHEQKFKDLLSSKCQVSPERIVLDMESEFMIVPGSIPTGDNIFHWIFCFHVVKPLMPILALSIKTSSELLFSLKSALIKLLNGSN